MFNNNEDISSIEDVNSDSEEDIDNLQFECPKCGCEHEKYIYAEYSPCQQCLCMSCKACRFTCDNCTSIHCFRCSNYFENCCGTRCVECSWFCNYDLEYYCNCVEKYRCNDCEEILCEKYMIKRKNNNIYCEDCNINYCENCDEYTEEIVCPECIEEIDNIFSEKLPVELVNEILGFLNF